MKRGTVDHPKVYDLCECLKCRRPVALGYLELLWDFAREYAPQGDIGRYSDKRIEAACDWNGASGRLISALTSAGWVDSCPDHRLIIHDWSDHAETGVLRWLNRHGLSVYRLSGKMSVHCPDIDRTLSVTENQVGNPPRARVASTSASASTTTTAAVPCLPRNGTWQTDESYIPFVSAVRASGAPVIDEDFADAWWAWKPLDYEQKLARVKSLQEHTSAPGFDPAFLRPRKFIEREWKRPIVLPRARESPASLKDRTLQRIREREGKA